MNQERVEKVLDQLQRLGVEQMILTDPTSIFYLTDKWIHPGERLLALYLNKNGNHKLFINELFTVPEDLGIEKVWFSDTMDGVGLLAEATKHDKSLGIDKNMVAQFLLRLIELNAGSNFVNTSHCIDLVRACKDDIEQQKMREVSKINDLAMEEFKNSIQEGMTELELTSVMEGIYKKLGADGFSFEPLVGFGGNAAIGHYEPGNTKLKTGDCILIDVGCKKAEYCADMTRTFFFQSVSEKQREVYELVRLANETAEAMIKPGVRFCEIDAAARKVITDAGYGPYFTHRLGHSIGMEVHEFGDVSSANENCVKPGMTFSIEPGIYLPGEVGVRIEDLVLVTETGVERLNLYTKELLVIK